MLRVLMLSKACIVGIYQRKLEHIAAQGVDLRVLVPPSWRDERGEQPLERVYTQGYALRVVPIHLNGNFHLHYYPTLQREIRAFRPHIVHIDEEPYNVAAWQALHGARRNGARALFFSWQNITRRYPPPFAWGERWLLQNVDYALAGTQSAADVWREKGYGGPLAVVPQFGIDPQLFQPTERPQRPFTIGYIGRLVPEKGILDLLHAARDLAGEWRLRIVGSGPQQTSLRQAADALGITERITWVNWVPSTQMPEQYAQLDTLVLPSRTRPNWKEQFGRVLVEAMASGVPVIGSDSGAIPGVIGAAGRVYPEGAIQALRRHLTELQVQPDTHAQLRTSGRERVLRHFTHASVAQASVRAYTEITQRHSLLSLASASASD
jgi:glycosyltransferase involved in cell wall biosynthesis